MASAKVITSQGELYALDASNQRRRLVDGGPVYPGDMVETLPGTRAVLAFRDDSRVTLGPSTRFRVDNFVYDERNAGDGRFLVSILRGSVRALTGLIGKANNRNVGFTTATATIGVRGTGVDFICTGACAGEAGDPDSGLTVFTWLGSVVVTPNGMTALEALQEGQGLFISPSGIQLIINQPTIDGQRPDAVDVPSEPVLRRDRFRFRGRPVRLRPRRAHRAADRQPDPAPGPGRSGIRRQRRRHPPSDHDSEVPRFRPVAAALLPRTRRW